MYVCFLTNTLFELLEHMKDTNLQQFLVFRAAHFETVVHGLHDVFDFDCFVCFTVTQVIDRVCFKTEDSRTERIIRAL